MLRLDTVMSQGPLQQLCINKDRHCLALPSELANATFITILSTLLYCLMLLMKSFAIVSWISGKLQPNLAL